MGVKQTKHYMSQQQQISSNMNFEVDELAAKYQMETLAIHSDSKMEYGGDIAPPIHMSATFRTGNTDQLTYGRSGKICVLLIFFSR